jgi:hypothetical protein
VVTLDFSSLEIVLLGTSAFCVIGVALLALNDRIEDHLPNISLEGSVIELLNRGDIDRAEKAKQIVSICDSTKTEDAIMGWVIISNIIAFLLIVFGALPLLFLLSGAPALVALNGTFFGTCILALILSVASNRIASERLKQLRKLIPKGK